MRASVAGARGRAAGSSRSPCGAGQGGRAGVGAGAARRPRARRRWCCSTASAGRRSRRSCRSTGAVTVERAQRRAADGGRLGADGGRGGAAPAPRFPGRDGRRGVTDPGADPGRRLAGRPLRRGRPCVDLHRARVGDAASRPGNRGSAAPPPPPPSTAMVRMSRARAIRSRLPSRATPAASTVCCALRSRITTSTVRGGAVRRHPARCACPAQAAQPSRTGCPPQPAPLDAVSDDPRHLRDLGRIQRIERVCNGSGLCSSHAVS